MNNLLSFFFLFYNKIEIDTEFHFPRVLADMETFTKLGVTLAWPIASALRTPMPRKLVGAWLMPLSIGGTYRC